MSTVKTRITHESPDSDKALKIFFQPPQGAPVISFIQPGESAEFEVSDCNELHVVEWAAEPKAEG